MTEQERRGTTATAVEEERPRERTPTGAANIQERRTAARDEGRGQDRPTTAPATAFNTTTYRYQYGTIPSIPVTNRVVRGTSLVPLPSSQGVVR